MIGSFWNLCRACPSMPVDKLHSEYRSTYRWHEFTGNSRPEVVRRAPAPNPSQFVGTTNEPPLPRRKKCPELAYKSHEFIIGSEYTDARNNAANRMPRSEERNGTPSRRSKSEGPPAVPNGRAFAIPTEVDGPETKQVSTLHELEPLVSDAEDRKPVEKQVTIQERKVTTRPFSQLIDQERPNHFITKKENFGFEEATDGDNKRQHAKQEAEIIMNGSAPPHSKPNLDLWFKEVVELRKKAGEYKSRGWGTEIDPELYNKQKDLWDQVSKRSSLSSLCLASTMQRPITKEEKEQENNKKTTPVSKKPRIPGQAYILDNKDEPNALPARFSHIRHHLERTTGPDVEEGALLPSPTREKLMPAITKRESESQRGSPKKTAASRHGSPQKGSPQKGSPKKVLKTRSQSVGPEHESPKRQIRSASTAPTTRSAGKKTPTAATGSATIAERKARPYEGEDGRDTAISVSSCSPQPAPEIPDEPIVKSPPEPTRVKSPEQIIMRSPDPVNWTVPLDTGKTFTVTQNVKEGENYSRPQSEIKASTPVEKPPPPPQSAPPELTEQVKMDAWKNKKPSNNNEAKSPQSALSPTSSSLSSSTVNKKPLPGSSIRVLEDPLFDVDVIMASSAAAAATGTSATAANLSSSSNSTTTTASTARSTATEVLEKARDRFDRFWGGNVTKEESV
ncbi:uncharacterized protein LOC133328703 isoform X3 [Musca vetustissima]|uniref:uncharacterized protein LOC133328703 isoform X3 n=1 Tax=Musca vetustissima TaxID=27455 RepID=UPI002AB7A190|nr:uncharacterized protein LOC133328703 isoform X3 [Musca vetustissima]